MTVVDYTTPGKFAQALAKGTPLVVRGMPNQAYHAVPDTVSSSAVKAVHGTTPAHLKYNKETPQKEKEAYFIGNAVHTLTLEPALFPNQYVITPPGFTLRSKENKQKWAQWIDAGVMPIKHDKYGMIESMAQNVNLYPPAADLLSGGESEISFFWECSVTGQILKCRADRFNEERGICIDLKTAQDANYSDFKSSCYKWGYFLQAAFYADGLAQIYGKPFTFYFIAVEKTPPYLVNTFEVSEEKMAMGREQYLAALKTLAWCVDMDVWPGYPEEVQVL
jgi:hypothetical protein